MQLDPGREPQPLASGHIAVNSSSRTAAIADVIRPGCPPDRRLPDRLIRSDRSSVGEPDEDRYPTDYRLIRGFRGFSAVFRAATPCRGDETARRSPRQVDRRIDGHPVQPTGTVRCSGSMRLVRSLWAQRKPADSSVEGRVSCLITTGTGSGAVNRSSSRSCPAGQSLSPVVPKLHLPGRERQQTPMGVDTCN